MSKLTHFEKDADVDRLKFEKWWATDDKSAPNPKEYAWQAWQAAINSQSLSQEAMRDEALEEAARVCQWMIDQLANGAPGMSHLMVVRHKIRALKREPNAAAQAAGVNDPTVHCPRCGRRMPVSRFATEKCTNKDCAKPYDLPAPAAPDIGTILLQLEGIAKHMRAAYPNLEGDAYWLDQAAEIIAALRRRPERPPSGEMVMVLQCATEMCRTFADHADRCRVCTINWQNLKAALSAAEASKEAK